MTTNPIMNELYDIRRQILAEHGDDLRGYLHSELERLKSLGHPIAEIKQRTIRSSEVVKLDQSAIVSQSSPTVDR